MRVLQLTLEEAVEVCKALSNEHRMKILGILSETPHNVNELAEKMNMPFSTIAVNVKKLEDTGLILTEMVPGRGTQKINSKQYDRIIINLFNEEESSLENVSIVDMPVGEYIDCDVDPGCGIVSESDYIGMQDDPRSFFNLDHRNAQLIYFRTGYIEYKFPNNTPYGSEVRELEFSAEICSEAPYHKLDWPSDITLWINSVEVCTWTSPSDFGGDRGLLTPMWWSSNNSQFGLMKRWKITESGCFLDGMKVSDKTVKDFHINEKPYIAFKIGVKKAADNAGGLNLFGNKFGNYEQGILMRLSYTNTKAQK